MKCSTCAETKENWESAIRSTQNPRHRKMLEVGLRHWWAEVLYDIDAVMRTLADDARYRVYGATPFGPTLDIDSAEQAREMYHAQFDAGLMPGGPVDEHRFACADWGFTTEGLHTLAMPGSGLFLPDQSLDPDALYLCQLKIAVVTPFDEAGELMKGEILYMGAPTSVERTSREEIVRLLGWDNRTYSR